MQLRKSISALLLVLMIIICNNSTTNAADLISKNIVNNYIFFKNIDSQINDLCKTISLNINLDSKYIKTIYKLAGKSAEYKESVPNIYESDTIKYRKGPVELTGANTIYKEAEFIKCDNVDINRPSKYYLPDALYSVSYDISIIISQRQYYNRGDMQDYFDSLSENIRQDILFYEAILIYTGEDIEKVDRLYEAYEKIISDRENGEAIVENSEIKDKFKITLTNLGFTSENTLNILTTLLSDDNNSVLTKDQYIAPYKLNYKSRENMMIAAMSLVGKVRYVWGGGHSGTASIDGINPLWSEFESLYPDNETSIIKSNDEQEQIVSNDGFNKCITSTNTWCPIHGYTSKEFHGETIHTSTEYIEARQDIISNTEIINEQYEDLLSTIDYDDGINIHLLDGLDCSGFASWLYNQTTDKYNFNSTARWFTSQKGVKEIEIGSKMLPGDVFAWQSHIVVIVGQVKNNSGAYVTIEQTPNVLRFGVLHYGWASSNDIAYAKQIATEANSLIGGIGINTELTKVRNISTVRYYHIDVKISELTDEEKEKYKDSIQYDEDGNIINIEDIINVQREYCSIGRITGKFLDEDIKTSYNEKKLKDMYALDIIQYTLTKLPLTYVTGFNDYNGELFNKDLIATDLGITIQK